MDSSAAAGLVKTQPPLITKETYRIVSCVFCTLAISGAISRTIIRCYNRQIRLIDDCLLLFACLCLIAATVLQNMGADTLYELAVFENTSLADLAPKHLINEGMHRIQQYSYPFGSLIWASIFGVKFSYLSFFRLLIDRSQGQLFNFWLVTTVVTFFAAVFDISSAYIACPNMGDDSYLCTTHSYSRRILIVESVTIALDILTDLLICLIPPYLLYKVRITTRQKIGVGSFLSLSVFMIVIAVVRIAKVHAVAFEIWATFWQQFEGCIAVLMVSLTAFRTLFITRPGSKNDPRPKMSDTYRRRLLWWSKKSTDSDNNKPKVSVPIPSATLTGIRTFIKGDPTASYNNDSFTTLNGEKDDGIDDSIFVRHDLETRSHKNYRHQRPSDESYV